MPLKNNAFTRGLMEKEEGYARVLVDEGETGLSFDDEAVVTQVDKDGITFLRVAIGWRFIGIETPEGMVHAARGPVTSKSDTEKLIGLLSSQAHNKRELLFKRPLDPPLVLDEDGCVTIVAPPGKLGLYLSQNGNGGTVVDKIERGSPIAPSIRPGMMLLKIDGEDVSNSTRPQVLTMLNERIDRPKRVLMLKEQENSPWPMRILMAMALFAILFTAFVIGGIIMTHKLEERRARERENAEYILGKLVANEGLGLSTDFLRDVAMPAMVR
jgi:hypothetical protein